MKKWLLSVLFGLVVVVALTIYMVYFSWGTLYASKHFRELVPSLITIFIISVLCFRVLIFSVSRLRELRRNAKTGEAIDMSVIYGAPNINPGTMALITLDSGALVIKSRIGTQTTTLPFDRITLMGLLSERRVLESRKLEKINGNAEADALKVGGFGDIIDALSDFPNQKEKNKPFNYFIINYTTSNGDTEILAFGNVGATMGLSKFIDALYDKTNIPKLDNTFRQADNVYL